jgi:hypothetical protein
MKVLFVIRASSHLRYHRSILEALIQRGHDVALLYDPHYSDEKSIEKAKNICEQIGCTIAPAVGQRGLRFALLRHTRDLLSWRRYLTNEEVGYLKPFRQDWRSHLPFFDKVFVKIPGAEKLLATETFAKLLQWFERVMPLNKKILRDLVATQPDVVLASPVNMRNSSVELEYLKAGRALGISVAIQVISWDNLTVRGLFHIEPDRLFCWNEVQADEARKHHAIPDVLIRVAGAPAFDAWFARPERTTSRGEFCKRFGLRPEDPIVTYLGSARNIAKDETETVKELRAALDRSTDPRLNNAQIALRVHPGNFKAYIGFDVPGCVEVPPRGSLPDTEEALQLFHDTLAHSVAVIQINTSGVIDSIIDGTPAISMLYPEFAAQQVETIHFKQLMESGATDLPTTAEECVQCVANLLDGNDTRKDARKKFVSHFIRPRGIEVSAGERVAEELELLVNSHPSQS